MTRNAVLLACVVAGVAGAAQAATVEFRIVEKRGQVAWTGTAQPAGTNDNILNFAVQARVVGSTTGEALGNFSFDIRSTDSESAGVFNQAFTSLPTGAYNNGATQYNNNAAVGLGGLSKIYSYLAGINTNFNGLINVTGGSFVNNPALNEIGLVTGSPTGSALLALVDTDFDGAPDTYTGSGTSADLDPAIAATYLASGPAFIDVYRFNYTMSSNAVRAVVFSLENLQAQTFGALALANGTWGPANPLNAAVLGTPVTIAVTPAPGAAALLGLGGLVAARRRRTA